MVSDYVGPTWRVDVRKVHQDIQGIATFVGNNNLFDIVFSRLFK